MRVGLLVLLALLCSACARERVVEQSANTITVSYRPDGLLTDREEQAYARIKEHCRGNYRITGRSEREDRSYVAAECVK